MYLCIVIFYFSGTGNSQWAAKLLASKLNEELIYIPDVIRGHCRFFLKDNERIGFIFPIHGWRPPLIVRDFIQKLEINYKNHYCYMLCTAGDSIGKTTEIFSKDLRKRNIRLDAAFSLIMPESYVGLPFFNVDPIEKENQKKQKAEEDLKEFSSDIEACRKNILKTVKGPLPAFFSGPVGGFFLKYLITDKPFHVINERCVKCGICADVCPVGDIIGGLGEEPRWKNNNECLSCFACYHHCPHHAIEYGGRTKNKGQYFFNRKHK